MRFWEENKKIVIFSGMLLLLVIVFRPWPLLPWPITDSKRPVLTWPWSSAASNSKSLVDRLSIKLQNYYPKEELKAEYPSPVHDLYIETLGSFGITVSQNGHQDGKITIKEGLQTFNDAQRKLNALQDQLDEYYSILQNLMAHVTYIPYRVPQWEEATPGMYFFQRAEDDSKELDGIRTALDDKEKDYRLHFDKDLGMSMVVPPNEKQTPYLLIQLGIIRDVTELAFRTGITRIDKILPSKSFEDKGSPEEEFFSEYPITFAMVGRLPSLMKFIRALNGVHGELSFDEKSKSYFVDRGEMQGLYLGERVTVTRGDMFVNNAKVINLEKERAQLDMDDNDDGHKPPDPEPGDRVSNHFYMLRSLEMEPTRHHILGADNHLDFQIQIAAIRFKEEAVSIVKKGGKKIYVKKKKPKSGRKSELKSSTGRPKHKTFNYKY